MLRICQQYLRMQHSEPVVGQSTHSDVHVDHRPADTHCNVHQRGGAIFQNMYCDVHAAWESGMGPEYRIAMSTQLAIASSVATKPIYYSSSSNEK